MTQEEKELLLRDLCARLPYGVIVKYKSQESEGQIKLGYGNIEYVAELGRGWWIDCKPYLRLMSSMTEEEKKNWLKSIHHYNFKGQPCLTHIESYDWLNAHHFDFRNLIERRLAIAVTEENNPYKE